MQERLVATVDKSNEDRCTSFYKWLYTPPDVPRTNECENYASSKAVGVARCAGLIVPGGESTTLLVHSQYWTCRSDS